MGFVDPMGLISVAIRMAIVSFFFHFTEGIWGFVWRPPSPPPNANYHIFTQFFSLFPKCGYPGSLPCYWLVILKCFSGNWVSVWLLLAIIPSLSWKPWKVWGCLPSQIPELLLASGAIWFQPTNWQWLFSSVIFSFERCFLYFRPQMCTGRNNREIIGCCFITKTHYTYNSVF